MAEVQRGARADAAQAHTLPGFKIPRGKIYSWGEEDVRIISWPA